LLSIEELEHDFSHIKHLAQLFLLINILNIEKRDKNERIAPTGQKLLQNDRSDFHTATITIAKGIIRDTITTHIDAGFTITGFRI
jgi:hypothetical protein